MLILNKISKTIILYLLITVQTSLGSNLSSLKETSLAFNTVAEKAIPAIVNISTVKTVQQRGYRNLYVLFGHDPFYNQLQPRHDREYKQKGLGSGVIISKDGYILTNNHVIEGVDEITVTLSDKRSFNAEIIGTDPKTDIALLKIKSNNLPTVKIGNSDNIKVGNWAIAIGSPFGLEGTMTVGIISAKGRSNVDIVDYSDLIQTDAAINPGNSGGALLNINSELIGINTAIFSKSGGYMGIGFAVPVNLAQRVMEDLLETGHVIRGWLGVYIQPITNDIQKKLSLKNKQGALVNNVIKDSPAEKSGIKHGDVITSVNNKPVKNFKELRNKISELRINQIVDIELIRRGKPKLIKVKISASPKDKKISKAKTTNKLGLKVSNVTKSLMEKYKIRYKEGVLIEEVEKESPAEKVGLQVGDIILEIDYALINSTKDYNDALQNIKKDSQSLLLIKRKEVSHFVVIKITE